MISALAASQRLAYAPLLLCCALLLALILTFFPSAQLGTMLRAKKKMEELQNVLVAQRRAAA